MTEDKMVGWHHWLDGPEFEQTPGVADGQGRKPGVLQSMGSQKQIFFFFFFLWLLRVFSWFECLTLSSIWNLMWYKMSDMDLFLFGLLFFSFGHTAWLNDFLSFPTRDWMWALVSESGVLTTGPPGNSLTWTFFFVCFALILNYFWLFFYLMK